jgi:TetR/AcrR family transcriptional regulator, mexJK operon transcriptional repressor
MTIPADTPLPVRDTTTTTVDRDPPPPRPTVRLGGRPSRSAALVLRSRILEVATDLFLAQGYGLTTIEAVARGAGVSKRTFYHRFKDKAALFAAVVHHIVETIRPPPEVPLLEGTTLDEILQRLARLILDAALSPPAIALNRLIIAESARFPEVVRAANEQDGTTEAHALVGGLLAREFPDALLPPAAREFATRQFLQLVIAIPRRRAMGFGTPMNATELDRWAVQVVTLFLNGCRGGSASERPA